MAERPLAAAVIFMCVGIFLAAKSGAALWMLIGAAVFLSILLAKGTREWLTRAAILLGFLIVGAIWSKAALLSTGYIGGLAGEEVTVTGKIISVQEYSQRREMVLRVSKVAQGSRLFGVNEKVLSVQYDTQNDWLPGDEVKLKGIVNPPSAGGNLGEFNYRDYLKRQGITARLTVADAQLLQSGGWTPLRFSAYVRRATVQRIFTVLPEEQAAVLVGMLLGEKQYLPEDDANLYRNLGVMHVFAVSGLHVGFVAALVISLLGKVTINTTAGSARVLRFMVTGAVLLFYAALAGFSASVVRAVAMTLVGIFSYVVDRRKDFYNALALAALAWLLYRPLALFDAGFQLSFAAALGIYYLNPAADKLLSFLPDWRSIVTVPLVAQLALLPPLAYHFGTVSLVSLLANIPVVFAAGAIIILGIVIMALQFVFWPVAELLLFSAGMLIEMVQRYLDLLGHIPFAYLYLRMPLPLEIVLYYIILVGLREGIMGNLPMAKDKGRWLKRGLAAALVILIIVGSIPGKKLEVIFLDVGQGDAALVMTPGGKNILIDAAGGGFGGFDIGRDRLLPALHRLGVRRIDLLVNSHPDRDHIGSLGTVAAEIPVDLALFPVLNPEGMEQLNPYLNALTEKNVKYNFLGTGMVVALDNGIYMEVLNPPKQVTPAWELNDQSLVVMLRHGDVDFLFTGDIEQNAVIRLLDAGTKIAAEVIKIPHHGSAGSFNKSFYQQTQPQVAVISVGRNNFGHPSPVVTSFLQRQGISVYRTDRDGAVKVSSDGTNLWVDTVH